MDINFIKNIFNNIDLPIIVWEYFPEMKKYDKLTRIWCNKNFEQYFCKDNVNNIGDKNIAEIFIGIKKIKYYKKCFKERKKIKYRMRTSDMEISKILIPSNNYIIEKIDILYWDKYLRDPFNMILIADKNNQIRKANFIFFRNTGYDRIDIFKHSIDDFFYNPVHIFNKNQIYNNYLITKNNSLINVDFYQEWINNHYNIFVLRDITIIKNNLISDLVFKNLNIGIIEFVNNIDNNFYNYECSRCNEIFLNILKKNEINFLNKKIKEIFPNPIYKKIEEKYKKLNNDTSFTITECFKYNDSYYEFKCILTEENILIIIIKNVDIDINVNPDKLIYKSLDKSLDKIIEKIREPVIGISNIINLLYDMELSRMEREYINVAFEHVYILLNLINDFVDYINIKTNRIEIEKDIFNIREELEQCYDILGFKVKDKDIVLTYEVDSNVPPYIIGDRKKIKQIIINIIENAIKFTNEGKIIFRINCEKIDNDNENNFYLLMEVEDTGMGISEKDQKKIFESFYQINDKKDSSGLGLRIVENLCQIMGGDISVKSELNKGSTFYIKILVEEYKDITKIESEILDEFKEKKVLIIDENAHNRINISKIILEWKMKPMMGSNSEEAIFLINNYRDFDVCLIDIDSHNRNSENSNECKVIRQIKEANGAMPIVAMSIDDSIKYNKNCIDYLILKPIKREQLLKMFINLFSDLDIKVKQQSTADMKIFNNLSILLVSNNKINQNIIFNILEKLNYKNSDIEANLDTIMDRILKKKYSLILFDIDMGIELKNYFNIIREVKKTYNKIFIIALLPNDNEKIKKKCNKNGVDAYMLKPIKKEELKALLKVISRKVK